MGHSVQCRLAPSDVARLAYSCFALDQEATRFAASAAISISLLMVPILTECALAQKLSSAARPKAPLPKQRRKRTASSPLSSLLILTVSAHRVNHKVTECRSISFIFVVLIAAMCGSLDLIFDPPAHSRPSLFRALGAPPEIVIVLGYDLTSHRRRYSECGRDGLGVLRVHLRHINAALRA